MEHTINFGPGITLTLSWEAKLPHDIDAGYRTVAGTLAVRLEPAGASLKGKRDVLIDAQMLDDFDTALARLLDDLNGSATLEPTRGLGGQGDFAMTIDLAHGKGSIRGFLAAYYHEARLSFAGYEIDQSYLQETSRQLRSLHAKA